MRTFLALLFFSTMFGSGAQAQGFLSSYGQARHQEAVAIVPDATGITAVVRDASLANGPVRIRLLRTDLQGGSPQWSDVDLAGSCFVQGAVASGDGNLVVCGSCIRPGRSDHDALLAKVSPTGVVLSSWLSDTPGQEEQLLGLERTADGGCIAAGVWRGSADRDALLTRFDAAGQPLWAHHYGTTGDELLRAVTAHDGGFTAVGRLLNFGGSTDTYTLHTDAAGTEQWWHSWGGAQNEELFDVVGIGPNVVMAGHTDTYGPTTHQGRHFRNVYVLAMESDGDTLWTRALGDTLSDNGAQTLTMAQNGDLLFGGVRGKEDPTEALVLRATATGTLLWKRSYPKERAGEVQDIRPLADNGFLAAGRCFGPLGGQVLLLKKDPQGQ